MAVSMRKSDFVEGRGGLLVPNITDTQVTGQDFINYLGGICSKNDISGGEYFYLPSMIHEENQQLRPAALLKYARDLLPEDIRKQNRMHARRSGGQCDYYTVGAESFTLSELPQHNGQVEAGLYVSRSISSIERVVGIPSKPREVVTVRWNEANAYDIAKENGDVTEASVNGVLSKLFSKMVTVFEA